MTGDARPEDVRLTEAEWRLKSAKSKCSNFGHDWSIITTFVRPVRLVCDRGCGDPGYDLVRTPTRGAADE